MSGYSGSLLQLGADFLVPGFTYTLNLNATNFLGRSGAQTWQVCSKTIGLCCYSILNPNILNQIKRSPEMTPTVSIAGPAEVAVSRNALVSLQGTVSSQCASSYSTIVYNWIILEGATVSCVFLVIALFSEGFALLLSIFTKRFDYHKIFTIPDVNLQSSVLNIPANSLQSGGTYSAVLTGYYSTSANMTSTATVSIRVASIPIVASIKVCIS